MIHPNIKLTSLLIFVFLVTSCKINQKQNGEKIGRWVFDTTIENKKDIHRGRYDAEGFQKGTWRYKYNGKLYKKEEFKNGIATTTEYHPNRKVKAKGHTKFEKKGNSLHYYYFGSWFIYDTKGKLIEVKHYNNGVLQHHTKL